MYVYIYIYVYKFIYISHFYFVLFNRCVLRNFPIKTLGISAILLLAILSRIIISIFSDNIKLWLCGPGSSVGIATDYGLDGPGSNPDRDEIFRPFRPALRPTQPPLQWVSGLSWG